MRNKTTLLMMVLASMVGCGGGSNDSKPTTESKTSVKSLWASSDSYVDLRYATINGYSNYVEYNFDHDIAAHCTMFTSGTEYRGTFTFSNCYVDYGTHITYLTQDEMNKASGTYSTGNMTLTVSNEIETTVYRKIEEVK